MKLTLGRDTNIDFLTDTSSDGACVSMYIPVHPSTRSETINEDVLRLKNNINAVKTQLNSSKKPKKNLLKQMRQIESLYNDTSFWTHQSRGLACFVNASGATFVFLPFEISEGFFIDNSFVVSPLLVMQSMDHDMYILDVNTQAPSLYYAKKNYLKKLEDAELPPSLSEALKIDEFKQSQQFHTGVGDGRAMFHGHGGSADSKDDEVDTYLRLLAHKVDLYFKKLDAASPQENTPLLLAGTKERVSQMQSLLSYQTFVEDDAIGRLEKPMKEDELLKHTDRITENMIATHQENLQNDIKEKQANEQIVTGEKAIATACKMNNIKTLLLPMLRRTNDSVREGVQRQYTLHISDEMMMWEKVARISMGCGARIEAIDTDEAPDASEPTGICRFALTMK